MKKTRLLLAASAAALIFACAKETEEAATAETEAVEPTTETEAVEPAADTMTDARTADANVEIGMQSGAPYFASASYGYQDGGSGGGGITLNTGDVDLSSIPPGDVNFTVTLNADAVGAGYSFPSDPYEAIAIVVIPRGVSAPPPQFGQQYWSAEFDAPSVSADGHSLMFVDQDEYPSAYEYAIGLNGPNGRVVMDPTIRNGGQPPAPEPEPVPE